MKLFWLNRKEDLKGISGTGIVAEGVVFENGQAVLRWRGRHSSLAIYHSVKEMMMVHNHHNQTELIYDDDPRLMELTYNAEREAQKWKYHAHKNKENIKKLGKQVAEAKHGRFEE